LGFTQRQIQVSRAHISEDRYRRKQLPMSIKTLGDLIQIKRYEKCLTPWKLKAKLNFKLTHYPCRVAACFWCMLVA